MKSLILIAVAFIIVLILTLVLEALIPGAEEFITRNRLAIAGFWALVIYFGKFSK